MDNMFDHFLNAPTGVTTSVAVTTANMSGLDLPFFINVGTAIYLFLLIVHKIWKIYKEYKGKSDASEE